MRASGWMIGLLVGMTPGALHAHPGHGVSDASTWLHYVGEPFHAALLLGVALLAIPLVRRALRRS